MRGEVNQVHTALWQNDVGGFDRKDQYEEANEADETIANCPQAGGWL
jgi:hypothetical protein